MKLDVVNYHTTEANLEYFSVSQFKSFLECEAKAMAELSGEYEREDSKALMMGAYVDAYFSNEMDEFVQRNTSIFNSRTGELKAEYKDCNKYIARAERDPIFMDYMDGDKQTIMTGELFDQPFKVKLDVFNGERIVDLKLIKDFNKVWTGTESVSFVDAWGYDFQGFAYQAIVEQNTGKKLPFYLAVITKEKHPQIRVIELPQWYLDSAGEVMSYYMERFASVKAGEIEPKRCELCGYCKDTYYIDHVMSYEDLLEMEV